MLGDELKELLQWMESNEIDLLNDEDFEKLMAYLREDVTQEENENGRE